MPVVCPTLRDITNEDQCLENFAGLGSVAYFFVKDDLEAPLVATKNVYAWLATSFASGKGFYRVELRENSQSFRSRVSRKASVRLSRSPASSSSKW